MAAAVLMSVAAWAQYGVADAYVTLDANMSTTIYYYSGYVFAYEDAADIQAAAAYISANGISSDDAKVIAYCNNADMFYNDMWQIQFHKTSFEDGSNRKYNGDVDKTWLAVIYNDGNSQTKFKVVSNFTGYNPLTFIDAATYSISTNWAPYNHGGDAISTPEPTSGLLLGMAGLALKRRD